MHHTPFLTGLTAILLFLLPPTANVCSGRNPLPQSGSPAPPRIPRRDPLSARSTTSSVARTKSETSSKRISSVPSLRSRRGSSPRKCWRRNARKTVPPRRRVKLTFDTLNKALIEIRVWIPKGEGPFPLLLTQPRVSIRYSGLRSGWNGRAARDGAGRACRRRGLFLRIHAATDGYAGQADRRPEKALEMARITFPVRACSKGTNGGFLTTTTTSSRSSLRGPVLSYAPRLDRFADFAEVRSCLDEAEKGWAADGCAETLSVRTPDNINRFQSAQQAVFLKWLRRVSHSRASGDGRSVEP